MTPRDLVAGWLDVLARKAGKEGFALDAQGRLDMRYQDAITTSLAVIEDDLVLSALLVPGTPDEAGLQRLLCRNYLLEATCGTTLSLDERGIVLWYACPVSSLDALGFERLLGNFFVAAMDNQRFAQGETEAPQGDATVFSFEGARGIMV